MSEVVKIVMIDDEPDLCLMTKENLEEKGGFQVVTVNDPRKAEEVVTQEQPAVILLDVVMPGRTGQDIIAALKKSPQTAKIPIIMVSGKGEMVYDKRRDEFKWEPNTKLVKSRGDLPNVKGAEALAEAYGVADYVSKPFTTDLLLDVITQVLEKYKKSKKKEEDEDSSSQI